MATERKISSLLAQQLPDFVQTEGANLVEFLKAYYEWTEQANNAVYAINSLRENQDVDSSANTHFEYFRREIMPSIPKTLLTDKRALAKRMRDVFRAKGSEKSFRLLFRALFGEEVEFYYPGADVLRASDGRWTKEKSIRVAAPKAGDTTMLGGDQIYGERSGATARVSKLLGALENGVLVDELYLTDINGEFIDGERIANEANTVNATIYGDTGPLQAVTVTNGGVGHVVNDRVRFTASNGTGANGAVTSTTDTAVEFYIVDGGRGYTNNATITITSGVGTGASFIINSISNTEVIAVNNDTIEPMLNVVINTGATFVSLGANTAAVSANLASANCSHTPISAALSFTNTTVGTINAISTTTYGYGYSVLPTISVVQQNIANMLLPDLINGGYKGTNADIRARSVAGVIQTVNVDNFGRLYNRFTNVTIENLSRAATSGLGTPTVSGVVEYPGAYIDTKGFLSGNPKLQDNFYYQDFSYEIISSQFVSAYRTAVKNALHPAGTKMFGKIRLASVTGDNELMTSHAAQTTLRLVMPAIDVSPEDYIDVEPQIEGETSANASIEGTVSTTSLFVHGTGELFATSNSVISDYLASSISTYLYVPVDTIGTGYLLIGNNTLFDAELPPGTILNIIDVFGPSGNAQYMVANTVSNNFVVLTTPFMTPPLEHGEFYYSSNTITITT